ncbi:carboxymuconolactone decarboxylase family protein [Kineosporia succinea]|uniref:Peroxidase-related enzyme n=1 Tax=Kineosporia succinea TaxID=84632 RepID=A0ABT9NVG1_9ACTN|nr:peroxidase-related enzyme [Kineosporia succinea]MDP9824410.1 putative peroxidase-related enzyme [Kineosporia succinea]
MSNVPLVDRDCATGPVKEQLDAINAAFGAVPAMFRAVANSPAALNSMWGSFGALAGGTLGPALGEQIAVAVADRNACEYCLAAHTALGRKAGLTREALAAAQDGEADDPRTAALLAFALKLVNERGQVGPADVEALREHGWGDEQIVETIAQVALNLFTNYVNIALDVPIDFPTVSRRRAG